MSASPSYRFVMCKPDFFEVSYAINPWMHPDDWHKKDSDLHAAAQIEWQKLCRLIRSLGGTVEVMPPAAGVPDIVFTANIATIFDGKAVLARFRHPERRKEEPFVKKYFEELKRKGVIDEIIELPEPISHEGEGDCIWDPHREFFWAGYGPRSSGDAPAFLSDCFGRPVHALQLITDEFYHLDTCFSPLSGGEILYYPPTFSEQANEKIAELAGNHPLIAVDRADANEFACNAVNMGRDIIMMRCSDRLRGQLEARGYVIHETPLSSFKLSGGSAFCLKVAAHNRMQ